LHCCPFEDAEAATAETRGTTRRGLCLCCSLGVAGCNCLVETSWDPFALTVRECRTVLNRRNGDPFH
jgi:hypothetical protein